MSLQVSLGGKSRVRWAGGWEGEKGDFGINRDAGPSPKTNPGTYTQISSIRALSDSFGGHFVSHSQKTVSLF